MSEETEDSIEKRRRKRKEIWGPKRPKKKRKRKTR
jgi:hypothetical protein